MGLHVRICDIKSERLKNFVIIRKILIQCCTRSFSDKGGGSSNGGDSSST